MQSLFLVLEGPDGAGTSLHARMLAERFEKEGHSALLTKEPTNGVHGTRLRNCLNGKEKLSPIEFQEVFCADRKEHLQNVILPALAEGKHVISDRYHLSTIVYGQAQGVKRDLLIQMGADFLKPSTTIVTLPSFAICRERLLRREALDAFEQEDFNRTVYDLYQAEVRSGRLAVLDTSGEKEIVAEVAWQMVEPLL